MNRRDLLNVADPVSMRHSEPPRRSARHQSTQSVTTDTSGAEDQPYRPPPRAAVARASTARPASMAPERSSRRSARGHRKSASFSKTVYVPFEVDVSTPWDHPVAGPSSKRRRMGAVEEDAVSERSLRSAKTEQSERGRGEVTPRPKPRGSLSRYDSGEPTPRANTAKRRKLHVRPSLGTSHALGTVTLDRRAEMVADIAGDCLMRLLSLRSEADEEEAKGYWGSLQVLRQTYLFAPDPPPFIQLHEFIRGLHPNMVYDSVILAHCLRLSNLCSFVWSFRFPELIAALARGLYDPNGEPSATEIPPTVHEVGTGGELSESMKAEVARRNAFLFLAWRKFWFIAVPKELRASDSALRIWLDFATLISRIWQCPTITPSSNSHPSLPPLPDDIQKELFSNTAVLRHGQWEVSDVPEFSDDSTRSPENERSIDADRRLVSQRWRELIRRRIKTLDEKRPEILARQFVWSKFSSELCAFIRIEVVESDLLTSTAASSETGRRTSGRRAGSEISIKRRLSSNPSPRIFGGKQLDEVDEDEEEDLETAESALEEPERARRHGPARGRASKGGSQRVENGSEREYGDVADFDFMADIIGEMEAEREASRKPSILSPIRNSRGLSADRPPSARARQDDSRMHGQRDSDGYMADFEMFGAVAQDMAGTSNPQRAIRASKVSSSDQAARAHQRSGESEDAEWGIRDLLPATQDLQPSSAQNRAAEGKQKFNFTARQLDAQRVDWESQTLGPYAGSVAPTQGDLARHHAAETPRVEKISGIPRFSLTRPSQPNVPTLATREAASRAPRDVTEEWVPTPGVFEGGQTDQEEEDEVIEEIELIEVTDDGESASEFGHPDPDATEEHADSGGHNLNHAAIGRGSSSAALLNHAGMTDGEDDDLLPDPALLKGLAATHEADTDMYDPREASVGVDGSRFEPDGDGDIIYLEQAAPPAGQAAFLSSRPRYSMQNDGFAPVGEAEDEVDRQLLRHQALSSDLDEDLKPFRDPDLLIAPGRLQGAHASSPSNRRVTSSPAGAAMRTSGHRRARARDPVDAFDDVAPPEPDYHLFDDDGELLQPDDTYVIPRNHVPQRSLIHGQVGDQLSSYSRISGRRRWTEAEEVLLYRTVQKVPLSEIYPLKVVWYLHGEYGTLSQDLAEFNPQHMKDKMRVIVDRRRNNKQLVVGRARYWLPPAHPDRLEFDREIKEIREEEARVTAEKRNRAARAALEERRKADAAKEKASLAELRAKEKKAIAKFKSKGKGKRKGKRNANARRTDLEESDELESEEGGATEDRERDGGDADADLNVLSTPPPAQPSSPTSTPRTRSGQRRGPTWAVAPSTPKTRASRNNQSATPASSKQPGSRTPKRKSKRKPSAQAGVDKAALAKARAKSKQDEARAQRLASRQAVPSGNGHAGSVAEKGHHEQTESDEENDPADVVPASHTEPEPSTDASELDTSTKAPTVRLGPRRSKRTQSTARSSDEAATQTRPRTRSARLKGPRVVLPTSNPSGVTSDREDSSGEAGANANPTARRTRSASARQESTSAPSPNAKSRPVHKMRMTKRPTRAISEEPADDSDERGDDQGDDGDGGESQDEPEEDATEGRLAPISEEGTQVSAIEGSAAPNGVKMKEDEEADEDDEEDVDGEGIEAADDGQTQRAAATVSRAMAEQAVREHREAVHREVVSGRRS